MRTLKGAFTLVAFSALVANVLGAPPVEPDQVEPPKVDYKDGEIPPPTFTNDGSPVGAQATSTDDGVDDPENEQYGPPTEEDFRWHLEYLKTQPGLENYHERLLFWSGIKEEEAKRFAISYERIEASMLLPEEWKRYTESKNIKAWGYWRNRRELREKFFNPYSREVARTATGIVWVLLGEQKADEQKNIANCRGSWCKVEKRALIERLKEGKVRRIKKFIFHSFNNITGAGEINELTD